MRNPHHARSTTAVHAGRADLGLAHTPPLDLSTTYRVPDPAAGTDSIDAWAAGASGADNPIYSRLHQPTVARFEQAMAALEGADASVAFASGMAAITAVLMAARSRGRHIVGVRPVYGGTDHLLSVGLLGFDITWVTEDGVAEAIREDTALVVAETPANPTLQLLDIASVVAQAGAVPVMVDATFATPLRCRPLEHGATYAVHSATKFLGGHGDVLAGVVSCAEPFAAELRQVRIATGAVLHPLGGYLLHRGLQTLAVRLDRAEANAAKLVERLQGHPAVSAVHWPGLAHTDPRGLLGRQLDGPGALLAIDVGTRDAARQVMAQVRLWTPAVSLGSCDSLIQHPAGLTHRVVDPQAKADSGIGPGLLRLSVGLEDAEDLWADLSAALESLLLQAAAR